MEDMERYGDYNEVAEPPSKSKVLTVIKILAYVLIFSVVGLLAFRLILFNYSPKEMKNIYFNEVLREYYSLTENDGQIGAKTQTLKAPYDDAKEGNFMCDDLIFIEGASQLQISLKLNTNLYNKLPEKLALPEDTAFTKDVFSFKLKKLELSEGGGTKIVESPSAEIWKSIIMYDFCKLVFDGVDFDEGEDGYWMVLEIFVEGQKTREPFAEVLLLDSTEEYYKIKDYKLSGGEKP